MEINSLYYDIFEILISSIFTPYFDVNDILARWKNTIPMEDKMKIEVIENIGKIRNSIFGNVLEALKECGVNGKVVMVNDIKTIMLYGVKSAPALIINGIVMFAGTSLPTEEIIKLLQQNFSTFT
jgi:hypothetical protein